MRRSVCLCYQLVSKVSFVSTQAYTLFCSLLQSRNLEAATVRESEGVDGNYWYMHQVPAEDNLSKTVSAKVIQTGSEHTEHQSRKVAESDARSQRSWQKSSTRLNRDPKEILHTKYIKKLKRFLPFFYSPTSKLFYLASYDMLLTSPVWFLRRTLIAALIITSAALTLQYNR